MTAYYNEIDPKAAAWLRELIKGGHIAAGDVDETDIRDVDPARLGRYTQCHFFAGIGGWSHALRLAGWPDDRPVWTGSCPCQPFSAAGRREGVADERHLWPHWHHLISVCRPPVVFGEQVASKDGLGWLDLVCADLEGSGYAVGAADLCAAGVGAPHIRQRLWFVGLADAAGGGHQSRARFAGVCRENASESAAAEQRGAVCSTRGLADASGEHLRRELGQGDGSSGTAKGAAWEWQRGGDDDGRSRANGGLADASGLGRGEVGIGDHRGHDGRQLDADVEDGGLADAECDEQRGGRGADGQGPSRLEPGFESGGCGAAGGLADASLAGLQGRSGGHGAECVGAVGLADAALATAWPSPTDGHWRDADWLFCRDGKWRPVEPGTFPLAHGVSARVGRLRGYGNAIVPQVAATFIRSVM